MVGGSGIQTVQALLEQALLGLRDVADPALPVRQAAEQLSLALLKVYEAHAAAGEAGARRESLRAMARHLHSAATLMASADTGDEGGLAELALIQQAMKAAVRALGEPLTLGEEERPELPQGSRPPLRASLREPRLLDPERELLLPTIPLPELPEPEPPAPAVPAPPPPVKTPQQLEALLQAAQARLEAFEAAGDDEPKAPAPEEDRPPATDEEALHFHFGTARSEQEVLLGHARTCMEDLAMFGLMRRPSPGNPWGSAERTERRLVRRVDALVACGPRVLPPLVKMLEERPAPDPELTWGNLFLLGSLAGDDALDQMTRLIHTVDLTDPAMALAVSDALALVPHPGIERAARPWLGAAEAPWRLLGVRVLARREALTGDEAVRAVEDAELEIVRAACAGLGAARGEVPRRALAAAVRHEDEEAARAALESALLRRSPVGLERALELTREGRGGFADAALFVAVGADASGAETLSAALAGGAEPTVLRALGWFGGLEFVDTLLEHLAAEPAEAKAAALESLQRLTGASLTKDQPDPHYERDERPFLQPFTPPGLVLDLTDDAPTWAAWWAKHGRNARKGTRYRYGHPWSPATALWELEYPEALPLHRRLAHVELAVRTGGAIPLDREDFVARQLSQLEAWKAHVEAVARRGTADGWSTRYAR